MAPPSVDQLTIKIFADGADLKGMRDAAAQRIVKGFTTNPTLMRQAGVNDYKKFALEALKLIPDRPISFEVKYLHYRTLICRANWVFCYFRSNNNNWFNGNGCWIHF